jgi:hypothetical protein
LVIGFLIPQLIQIVRPSLEHCASLLQKVRTEVDAADTGACMSQLSFDQLAVEAEPMQ